MDDQWWMMMAGTDHFNNIEHRCQELARDLNLVSRGELKSINYSKVSSLVRNIMRDLYLKPEDYRWESYTNFIGAIMENHFGLDPLNVVIKESGPSTEFDYVGENNTGFRGWQFRTKLISSMLMEKLIGAYLSERGDIPKELKSRPTGVKDVFAYRMVVDHPSTPAVDLVRLHDERNIDELLDIVEKEDGFKSSGSDIREWESEAEKGFGHLFRMFMDEYARLFEKNNEKNLIETAESIEDIFPTNDFELVNVGEFPFRYTPSSGGPPNNYSLTAASQDFVVPGDPSGSMTISEDFLVFEDVEGAEAFSGEMKEKLKNIHSDGGNHFYRQIKRDQSRHIEKGCFIKDEDKNAQYILCQLRQAPHVFVGFRGSLNNPHFFEDVFGGRNGKSNEGLMADSLGKLDPRAGNAFSLRLMAVETPVPYSIEHYTDERVISGNYGLDLEDSDGAVYYKNYVDFPRRMRGSRGKNAGSYKAVHFVARIRGKEDLQDRMEFQLMTSKMLFEAERGEVSHKKYEEEKRRRSDPRKNQKALPGVKGPARKRVHSFLDAMEIAILEEYRGRIKGSTEGLESLFQDEGIRYDSCIRDINMHMKELINNYLLLEAETLQKDKSGIIDDIMQIPYRLAGLVDDIGPERERFLNDVCRRLESQGFDYPSSTSYFIEYKKVRSLIDHFVDYSQESGGSKAESIALQGLAMLLERYEKEVPESHSGGKENFQRFRNMIDNMGHFIRPAIKKMNEDSIIPHRALDYVPAGFNGKFQYKHKQKAYDIAGGILSDCGLEDRVGEANEMIDLFCSEIKPSKKKNYVYVLPES
ncbi:MAG: hypothetical protein R6U32_02185 [Candidatus Woesearchaeota archaeon]